MRMATFKLLSGALLAFGCGSCPAAAEDVPALHSPEGSTHGVASDSPRTSVGAQLGTFGATGVTVQMLGVEDGASGFGLLGSQGQLAIYGEYLVLFNDQFEKRPLGGRSDGKPALGYNDVRGEVLPYLGGGVQIGRWAALRVPFGVEYTMLRDPFNFFGGGTMVVGRTSSDDPLALRLWINLGARFLL